jgi:hypothetical protein
VSDSVLATSEQVFHDSGDRVALLVVVGHAQVC